MSKAMSEVRSLTPKGPGLVSEGTLLAELTGLSDQIADRAYQLFEARGRARGRELDDWLRAESELLRPVPVDVAESADVLRLRAEVPGFMPEDLRIEVGPRRVVISGRSSIDGQNQQGVGSPVVERRRICRIIELPVDVRVGASKAWLQDGVLELTLPRSLTIQRREVQPL